MADENTQENDPSNVVLPPVAELNAISAKCAKVAKELPTALDLDEIKGLAEPATKKVAEEAVKKCCGGASDYLKKVKPEIQQDLEKASKKCCGGCSKSQKEKIKRKGGSCGGARASAQATAQAAGPGFCPGESVAIFAKIQAAYNIAKTARSAAMASLGTTPAIITMAEGEPATPTITELLAVIGELLGALESLMLTQEALMGKMYP